MPGQVCNPGHLNENPMNEIDHFGDLLHAGRERRERL
jgi:hypothetical protein